MAEFEIGNVFFGNVERDFERRHIEEYAQSHCRRSDIADFRRLLANDAIDRRHNASIIEPEFRLLLRRQKLLLRSHQRHDGILGFIVVLATHDVRFIHALNALEFALSGFELGIDALDLGAYRIETFTAHFVANLGNHLPLLDVIAILPRELQNAFRCQRNDFDLLRRRNVADISALARKAQLANGFGLDRHFAHLVAHRTRLLFFFFGTRNTSQGKQKNHA